MLTEEKSSLLIDKSPHMDKAHLSTRLCKSVDAYQSVELATNATQSSTKSPHIDTSPSHASTKGHLLTNNTLSSTNTHLLTSVIL
jgi:hypothetical protein